MCDGCSEDVFVEQGPEKLVSFVRGHSAQVLLMRTVMFLLFGLKLGIF